MSKAPRRVRDKWRLKEWYEVFSPHYFEGTLIATIPCNDPAKLLGRVIETTLYDITNDFAHQSTKLYFLVTKVNDHRAETVMKSHEYSTDYMRSLVRRGSSRIDGIFKVITKDQFATRISIVAFARDRINSSQKHGVRDIMMKICGERASSLNYDQLCQEMVNGKLGSDVYNGAKRIGPLRHVGVRKSKLLAMPSGMEGLLVKPAQEAATPQTDAVVEAESTS